jgi:hypothetical protein
MQPARAQRIASQPVRSASARASHPVQRSALPRIPCIAAHCIASCTAQRTARMQPARAHRPAHRKQSAHRQPARHASPAAPAAHHPPHGAHLTPAALHALRSTLRWFRLVRGTNFSKIQFIYIANCEFVMCSNIKKIICKNFIYKKNI